MLMLVFTDTPHVFLTLIKILNMICVCVCVDRCVCVCVCIYLNEILFKYLNVC